MNPLSGYIELELAGETLAFKFGTNAWSLFCEKRKMEFYEIATSGVFGKEKGEEVLPPDIFALMDLYYFAYVSAERIKKQTPKFSFEEFTAMIDETPEAMLKLQKTMLQAKIMGYKLSEFTPEEGKDENFPKT